MARVVTVLIIALQCVLTAALKKVDEEDDDDFAKELQKEMADAVSPEVQEAKKIEHDVEVAERRNTKRKIMWIVAIILFALILACCLRNASNKYWWYESDDVKARKEIEAAEYIAVDVDDPQADAADAAFNEVHDKKVMAETRLKISDLDRSAFHEIRQMPQPPPLCLTVCTSACRILGHSKKDCDEWSEVQQIMHDEHFRKRVLDFKPLSEVTLTMKKAKNIKADLDKYTIQEVHGASRMIAALFAWAKQCTNCVITAPDAKRGKGKKK